MDINNLPLEEFDFSVRTYNTLKRAGIQTGGELLKLAEGSNGGLRGVEHLKTISFNEILLKLSMLGYPIIAI
jgi:DNA-directed RNA polymerase alpha subunit